MHAIAACLYIAKDPFKYFIAQYTVLSYKKCYEHLLIPFSLEDLRSNVEILPLVYKKQRGWLKTKRI
jgi:hypothetical protein